MSKSPRTRGSDWCRSPRDRGIRDSSLHGEKRLRWSRPRCATRTLASNSSSSELHRFGYHLQPVARHRLNLELFHRALEADFEGLGAFLERHARQRTLDEQRKPADINERLTGHVHAQQLDRRGTKTGVLQCGRVLIGAEPLHRSGMTGVLDLDALLTQRLHGAHDPAPPEAARSFDIRAIEKRAVEREQPARLQHAPDLFQHLYLIGHQMNGVEEYDRVR